MDRVFVDSNVFVHFFVRDDAKQADEAEELFTRAKRGEIALLCGPPVFFEVAWVLHFTFRLPHAEVLNILDSMLSMQNFTVFDADIVIKAISLARRRSIGFADAYIAATAIAQDACVATFNLQHFKKTGVRILYQFTG
jgi:predicted nucleic acid-binding protein